MVKDIHLGGSDGWRYSQEDPSRMRCLRDERWRRCSPPQWMGVDSSVELEFGGNGFLVCVQDLSCWQYLWDERPERWLVILTSSVARWGSSRVELISDEESGFRSSFYEPLP